MFSTGNVKDCSFSMWGFQSAKVGSSAKLLCTGIQGIYALIMGRGPSAKEVFCLPSVVYWHSRNLYKYLGGPMAKVGLSAKCCVLVFKASILYL